MAIEYFLDNTGNTRDFSPASISLPELWRMRTHSLGTFADRAFWNYQRVGKRRNLGVQLIYDTSSDKPKACILTKFYTQIIALNTFIFRDIVTFSLC